MTKLENIEHAKNYIAKLSAGVDPITSRAATPATLHSEDTRKCSNFVYELLTELINNNGVLNLSEEKEESAATYELVKKKAVFALDYDSRAKVKITENPISPSAFLKNINSVIDKDNMEKLSITKLNKWLSNSGFVEEVKVPVTINRTVRRTTEASNEIGITTISVPNIRTGETKEELVFTKQAQEFILDNIEAICAV